MPSLQIVGELRFADFLVFPVYTKIFFNPQIDQFS